MCIDYYVMQVPILVIMIWFVVCMWAMEVNIWKGAITIRWQITNIIVWNMSFEWIWMTFNIESQKQAGKCQRFGMRGWDTERAISGRQLSGRARKSVRDWKRERDRQRDRIGFTAEHSSDPFERVPMWIKPKLPMSSIKNSEEHDDIVCNANKSVLIASSTLSFSHYIYECI